MVFFLFFHLFCMILVVEMMYGTNLALPIFLPLYHIFEKEDISVELLFDYLHFFPSNFADKNIIQK